MAKHENFTADRVAKFVCQPGKQQSIYWDGKTPGLGLRVTAAGNRSYIFEAWLNGKSLRVTIGDPRSWTLGDAQEKARSLRVLTDQGIDPRRQEKDKQAQEAAKTLQVEREGLTVGDVWPVYLEARKPKWSERHYRDHVRLSAAGGRQRLRSDSVTVSGALYPMLSVRLVDLDADCIASWLDKESTVRPTSAAQSYRLLRAFIRWLAGEKSYAGLVPDGAYSGQKVREAVPTNRAKEEDSLQREQLPLWFDAVRKIGNSVISAYLQGLLITGARREELAGLKWEDVDFQWRSLTIRDKVEGTRTIPLTPYLASLLSMLPRRNQWVFSSPTAEDGKIAEPRIAHVAALKAAGLPHITLHGLRRSFGTLCEWVEMPSGISAQIMGHKPSALAEKHYRRRPLDLLRKWHDKIEAWLLEQAGIKFDAAEQGQGLRVVKY